MPTALNIRFTNKNKSVDMEVTQKIHFDDCRLPGVFILLSNSIR